MYAAGHGSPRWVSRWISKVTGGDGHRDRFRYSCASTLIRAGVASLRGMRRVGFIAYEKPKGQLAARPDEGGTWRVRRADGRAELRDQGPPRRRQTSEDRPRRRYRRPVCEPGLLRMTWLGIGTRGVVDVAQASTPGRRPDLRASNWPVCSPHVIRPVGGVEAELSTGDAQPRLATA